MIFTFAEKHKSIKRIDPKGLLWLWLQTLLYPGCHKVPPQVITPGQLQTPWQTEAELYYLGHREGLSRAKRGGNKHVLGHTGRRSEGTER